MQRRIDHLVVAVQDLDGAAAFYERLGFQVGARNRHPWGTENRIVQMRTSFIELITASAGVAMAPDEATTFSFGAFVKNYLARREGLAMLVLDTADAKADALTFRQAGIGDFEPFFFERSGRKPDGSPVHVAFTLAFAQAITAPLAGFFVCQQHFPENFWNAAYQRHGNGAQDVEVVALSAPSPEDMEAFLSAFAGVAPTHPAFHDLAYPLAGGGHLDVMTPDDAGELYGSVEAELDQPAFVAYTVRVDDLHAQERRLADAHIPFSRMGTRLVVPASAAFGVAIAFEAT
ncbi:VOC family protein [Microvirga antarctica]|uniref:VOC family protein n=1 Tax=Microvirga antarctica TaxID=2819233 RepID=UPI001B300F19|nr:VOC family protein [Microvirga antarctica]